MPAVMCALLPGATLKLGAGLPTTLSIVTPLFVHPDKLPPLLEKTVVLLPVEAVVLAHVQLTEEV